MKLACQLAAFGFLLYAIASAPLTHILNPTTPAAAAVPRSFQEEDAEAATHLYKEEASSGKNPVVAQYAREMLPRLSQHYRNALRLSATINAPVAAAKRDHIPASHKS